MSEMEAQSFCKLLPVYLVASWKVNLTSKLVCFLCWVSSKNCVDNEWINSQKKKKKKIEGQEIKKFIKKRIEEKPWTCREKYREIWNKNKSKQYGIVISHRKWMWKRRWSSIIRICLFIIPESFFFFFFSFFDFLLPTIKHNLLVNF